ncbi:MAG: putative Ig domain-containing protein [Faecalibacterium sp.]|nr:putative Ig domain-containing protein [Faecalibacterium sp.]
MPTSLTVHYITDHGDSFIKSTVSITFSGVSTNSDAKARVKAVTDVAGLSDFTFYYKGKPIDWATFDFTKDVQEENPGFQVISNSSTRLCVSTALQLQTLLGTENAALNNKTVTLQKDVFFPTTILFSGSEPVVLDLNGHTLSAENGYVCILVKSGTLQITNGSVCSKVCEDYAREDKIAEAPALAVAGGNLFLGPEALNISGGYGESGLVVYGGFAELLEHTQVTARGNDWVSAVGEFDVSGTGRLLQISSKNGQTSARWFHEKGCCTQNDANVVLVLDASLSVHQQSADFSADSLKLYPALGYEISNGYTPGLAANSVWLRNLPDNGQGVIALSPSFLDGLSGTQTVLMGKLATSLTPTTSTVKAGTAVSLTLHALGGAPIAYSYALNPASDPLPKGMVLSADGCLSGTPCSKSACGGIDTYTLRIDVRNSYGTETFPLTLIVDAPVVSVPTATPELDEPAPTIVLPKIQSILLPDGIVGNQYRAVIKASGEHLVWRVLSGTLPDGLSFEDGELFGTPIQPGTFCFRIKAANSAGCAIQEYTVSVKDSPTLKSLSNWTIGQVDALAFSLKNAGSVSMTAVLLDGVSIPLDSLERNGDTLMLSESILQSLEVGSHELCITLEDGSVCKATFVIMAKPDMGSGTETVSDSAVEQSTTEPSTQTSRIPWALFLAAFILLAAVVVSIYLQRKKH